MKRYCNSQHRSRGCGLILLLLATAATNCNCFGVSSTGKQAHSFRLAAVALPDISDVLNGESCVDAETEKFFDGTTPISLEGEAVVSSFAPQLTYEKYLTMQVYMQSWALIQNCGVHLSPQNSVFFNVEQTSPRAGSVFSRVRFETLFSDGGKENQRSLSRCKVRQGSDS